MIIQKSKSSLFVILAVVMMSACFISCGDDDSDDGKISIVGTWVDGIKTMKLGSDGSYYSTINTSIPQYRKGSYSYNSSQGLMTVNVEAVKGQNGAYQDTYIVQTLTETTLVLLYTDGDVEGYYTRE